MRYIALGSNNNPIADNKSKTKNQWLSYAKRTQTKESKILGFLPFIALIPTWISGREYEYIRINYSKK